MKLIIPIKTLLFITLLFVENEVKAQYTNDWLSGKFSQTFVKIGVRTNGLQKITFAQLGTAGLIVNDANKEFLNVYYRGNLVKIARINATDFEFYAEINDGSRDSLLYRPTTARMNPYYSQYSDIGAYFVTIGNSTAKASIVSPSPLTGSLEPYHLQNDVSIVNTALVDYSHGPWALYYPFPNESFFRNGETLTGPTINGSTKVTKNFNFTNLVTENNAPLPKLELMVNGRDNNTQKILVTIGASTSPIYTFNFSGFSAGKTRFDIPLSEITGSTGSFSVRGDVGSTDVYRFSLTYYKLTYPQKLDMAGKNSYLFTIPTTTNSKSRVKIDNLPANASILDISDPNNCKLVDAAIGVGNSIEIMVPRESGKELKLFITNTSPNNNVISKAPLLQIEPANYNYLILTNKTLIPTVASYSAYRASVAGGSYKPLVMDIDDIYNQFNYGEPSPLAIKQFVDYMLSKGITDKHQLFLVGRTVSASRYLTKELPGYIPTIGYPGSDILLTAGLQGSNINVPAIPVGRLATNLTSDVTNYLNKVILYESKENQQLWRKQVLHINGGHTVSEINQFKDIMTNLESFVENQNTFKGKDVIPYVKQGYVSPGDIIPVNIANDLNAGVGMISYFGHGSPNDTDYNLKRFSAEPVYNNVGKYPFMYFNGCGVSNIFANYGNSTINAREDALANTWVLANGKGAIANIGGTLLSYVQPTEKYLKIFYDEIFASSDPVGASLRTAADTRQTIGRIIKSVAEKTILASPSTLDITNIHQSLLLGDPAIVILPVDQSSLPVNLTSFLGRNTSPTEILLSWTTIGESNNRNFIVEKSSDAIDFEQLGIVDGKGTTEAKQSYSLTDRNPLPGKNYYRLKQTDYDGTVTTSKIISVQNSFGEHIVFPNPVSGDHIGIKTSNSSSIISWKLFTIDGKLIKFSNKIDTEISMKELKSAEYILEIKTSDNAVTRKIVIKK